MNDLAGLLDRIEREFGPQYPGASEAELMALTEAARPLFGTLPSTYLDLLRRSNGIDVNGLVVYGTCDLDGTVFRFGLVESNQRLLHGVVSIPTTLRFIGERDDQLLAFDRATQQWKVVDRYAWDPDSASDVHATFEAMASTLIKEALA